MPPTRKNDNQPITERTKTMNPYGVLTTYEERMKANLQQYQRPEKAGIFRLRLDHRTWGKHMCLFCYFTDLDTGEKIRLACWRGAGERYAPRKCTIDFAKVRDRTGWRCTLAANVYGIIDWIDAEPL